MIQKFLMRLCILHASSISLRRITTPVSFLVCRSFSQILVCLRTSAAQAKSAKNGFLSYSINTEQANQQKFARLPPETTAAHQKRAAFVPRQKQLFQPSQLLSDRLLSPAAMRLLPERRHSDRSSADKGRAGSDGSLA